MSQDQFSGEVAGLYQKVFGFHAHPQGPWKVMDDKLHIPDGSKVLDLASGPGEPGLMMAKNRPNVQFTLSDLSPDMLEKAKQRSQGVTNVNHAIVDMEEIPFENDSFDAVVCCYGLMFPPDIQLAVNEVFRVLKPGGMFINAHWTRLDMMVLNKQIMDAVFDHPPSELPINPLSLSQEGLVEKYMTNAGFDTKIQTVVSTYPFPLSEKCPNEAFQVSTIPIHDILKEQAEKKSGTWELAESVFHKVAKEHGWEQDDGQFVVNSNTFKVCVATKPMV